MHNLLKIFKVKEVDFMEHEKELSFLRQALGKCRLATQAVSLDDTLASTIDRVFLPIFAKDPEKTAPIRSLVDATELQAIYKLTDAFLQSYLFFSASGKKEDDILMIGPYLSEIISSDDIFDIGDRMGFSPREQKLLERYYKNLPVISERSHIFAVIDAFCELAWDGASYPVIDVKSEQTSSAFSIRASQESMGELDETLANMKLMEERYAWENELIRAVAFGQSGKADRLLSMFSESFFEKRTSDSIRNMKNYCIIMNTLLRKAAEQGGVHPIYLDKVSTSFALKIEQSDSISKINDMMPDMLREYFRLVRKHSLVGYSPIVKKTVIIIDSDVSADLSLSSLAETQNISEGYLATVFKKETGKTVTEYIRERRIKHAKHLLSSTDWQIQTVALNCGIMDVQYFSKLFKREVGKSPKEYRESLK